MAIEEEFAVEVPDAEADKIRSKIRSCGDAIPTAYLSARPLFLGRFRRPRRTGRVRTQDGPKPTICEHGLTPSEDGGGMHCVVTQGEKHGG